MTRSIGNYKIAYTLHACMTKRVVEIPRSTHAFAVEKARIIILKNRTNQMKLNGTKRMMHLPLLDHIYTYVEVLGTWCGRYLA
jgi:hypothetical protein